MLQLKEALPTVDVSRLVAGYPGLLLHHDVAVLEANLSRLRWAASALQDNLCSAAVSGIGPLATTTEKAG